MDVCKVSYMTNTNPIEIHDYDTSEACGMVANADGFTAYVQAASTSFLVVIEQPNGTYTTDLVVHEDYRSAIAAAMDTVLA